MAFFRNTLSTKLVLDRIPGVRGMRYYSWNGAGSREGDCTEVLDDHLTLKNVKHAIEEKWIVPVGEMPAMKAPEKAAAAPVVEEKVPDLTKTISETMEAPKVETQPIVETSAVEEVKQETKAERRARRQAEQAQG